MISASNVSLSFGGRKLFDDVNIKFTPGNCYGLIGANGAGKSTFVKILAGDLEPNTGSVNLTPGERLSVLRQDHFAYEEFTALQTVMMGNEKLYKIMQEKDALYAKEDFTEEDGIKSAELEAEFAEMNGWEAESDAGIMLSGLGINTNQHNTLMKDLPTSAKVKVLLGRALFGKPDVLLLDEPTNNLDIKAIKWLENFLYDFQNTVIVVSHDRHFLNQVCTHIADLDFGKIQIYSGNYDFWRKSAELAQQLRSDQKKKDEQKAKELKDFIAKFSANASKAKQATSRQKQLEKLELGSLPISSRKYPFVHFEESREAGKEVLSVNGINKTIDGKKVLDNLSFTINKGDKLAFLSDNDVAITTLFKILMGEEQADSGEFKWGITINKSYFPADNSSYFMSGEYNLVDWLKQFSEDQTDTYIRGFLGKMLFSGEEALKKTNVLSGGEKVRCVLSRMMLEKPNAVVLDGPTAHLDLESITAVNEGVCRFKGTTLFTSHDHEFIQTVANRIIDIGTDGKLIEDKYITYDEYLESKIK
ncbi:MAG: ATP-binding cassette domain-containing protein [Bacteriovoracaceae bacterium]|jgi:ATPase subunit of ABC transporter with duplicated ATPase domains|nr:ATP-binding cassette domain-containing protein [Bacteriovoracaceae bacterium]